MFGGGKKKATASGNGGKSKDLSMFGIGGPPNDSDDDDSGLLAELAALEGGAPSQKKSKPKQAAVNLDAIEKMAAVGMRDVDDDDDDDDDFDESELLAELEGFSEEEEEEEESKPLDFSSTAMAGRLEERKAIYSKAIQAAKSEGSTSKVRRYERALKEIESLLKNVQKGHTVKEDDIPPPVVIATSKPIDPNSQTLPAPSSSSSAPVVPLRPFTSPTPVQPPTAAQPPTPAQRPPAPAPRAQVKEEPPKPSTSASGNDEKVELLLHKQKQFKVAALQMKHAGNIEEARKHLSTSKQFDSVIAAVREGKEVDLSSIPEPPQLNANEPKQVAPKNMEVQNSSNTAVTPPKQAPITEPPPQVAATSEAVAAPTTILEALEQRLSKYVDATNKAKEEENSGKVRRMGRIVKQYQDAIKATKAKRVVDYNELPCPPGFGPIPGVFPGASGESASLNAEQPSQQATPPNASTSASPSASQPPSGASRNEREYDFLVNRQKEFKMAALQAKKGGDMEGAREYFRQAKGMDQMVEAANNGLRVDVTTVPTLRRTSASIKRTGSDSGEVSMQKQAVTFNGSTSQQYQEIERALRTQIETSQKNSQHYKLLGNLDAAKNFESLLNGSKKDLETLLYYKKQNGAVPKCNYVMKTFPVIKSNPQLSDSELELTIVRCVNVPLPSGWQPKDMYVYVTYEFPFPQEKPQLGNTTTKKETVNPEYDESFKIIIDRKNRSFARACKRQTCNVKVHYVRGFLKSDKALGQASIKLEHFSNKCEIHESVDLMDLERGRKSVGGKIEVMLKIREPLADKDAEIVKEKWLLLDTHLRNLAMKTSSQSIPQPSQTVQNEEHKNLLPYDSLEVLNYEKEIYERQLQTLKSQGKQPPLNIIEKLKSCNTKSMSIQNKMKQGGKKGILEYYENLLRGIETEKCKAQNALRANDKNTAKQCLVKKKLIEKELGAMKQRLGI